MNGMVERAGVAGGGSRSVRDVPEEPDQVRIDVVVVPAFLMLLREAVHGQAVLIARRRLVAARPFSATSARLAAASLVEIGTVSRSIKGGKAGSKAGRPRRAGSTRWENGIFRACSGDMVR
jgi:hypothetical protein